MTSPSRKIDPATTMRGDVRQADAERIRRDGDDVHRQLRSDRSRDGRQRVRDRPSAGSTRASRRRRSTGGRQRAEHACRRPCRASPRTRAAAAPVRALMEIGRERGGAGRIVRRVEQQLAAVGQAPQVQAAGPSGCREAAAIASRVTGMPRASSTSSTRAATAALRDLVRGRRGRRASNPDQRSRCRTSRISIARPRSRAACRAIRHASASGSHLADHDRHTRLDDAGLLGGDRRSVDAEVLLDGRTRWT